MVLNKGDEFFVCMGRVESEGDCREMFDRWKMKDDIFRFEFIYKEVDRIEVWVWVWYGGIGVVGWVKVSKFWSYDLDWVRCVGLVGKRMKG